MRTELDRVIRLVAEMACESEEMRAFLANAGVDARAAQVDLAGILSRAVEAFGKFYGRQMPQPERLMTVQEVADHYRMTRQWAYHCKDLKKIAKKVGRRVLYPESRLPEFEALRAESVKNQKTGSKTMDIVMRHKTTDSQEDNPNNSRILMLVR